MTTERVLGSQLPRVWLVILKTFDEKKMVILKPYVTNKASNINNVALT